MNQFTKKGFMLGLIATGVMSILMLIGKVTDINPIPEPIPIDILTHLIGDVGRGTLTILSIMAHFLYGGIAGAIFYTIIKKRGTLFWSLGFGVLMWLILQFIVFPLLGWGVFGTVIDSKILIATLILHLVYGFVLGFGFQKKESTIK